MNVTTIVDEETTMRLRRKSDALVLHIMLRGHIAWSTPGEGKVLLYPGEYSLLNMSTGPQEVRLSAGVSEFIQLDIPAALVAEILPASRLVRALIASGISCQSPVSSQPIESKFSQLIDDIRKTIVRDGIQQLRLYAQITELITAAIDSLEKSTLQPWAGNIHERLIFDIKTYINLNLNKRLTLSVLAAAFYISESKLKKDFRKHEQQTVIAYLQEQRMQRAIQLLQVSDSKISHIAQEVGYSNLSSFTREFRKHFACSPKTIRTGHKNKLF
jgi:AraC-like DNA-binding protein